MARGKKREGALTPEEKLEQALVPDWEQPYKVPGNWCWTTIGAINQYSGGSIDPLKEPDSWFELYSVPSSADNYPEIVQGFEIGSTKQEVQKNDVLLCKINPRINRVWSVSQHTGNKLLGSSEWIVVRNPKIDSRYLMWCFQTRYFREYMLSNVSGVGGSLMRAQPKYVQGYPIPIAPLAEQKRIVDRIESLFARMDEAKEKAQSMLDSFETRKAAILHKAFTGELTAKWRAEHGVGKDSWESRSLKNCGLWYGGGTPSTAHPEYWENGTLLWITSKDMKSDLIEDTLMHTTMLGVENSSANYIEEPAVLFVMRSGILRRTFPVCMVKKPFTVNQDLKALVPRDIDLEYLFWACKAAEKEILEKCMKSGTTVESINASALQNFLIPIAGKKEQKEIVRILDSLFAKEQQAREAAEAVLEKIDLLKKSILARAFRGELGTNDPSEESAVELLKDILEADAHEAPKKRSKSIPKELQEKLETELERKIIHLYFQRETDSLPAEVLLSVSSKKFDVLEALHNLEHRGLIKKLNNGNYRLLG